MSQKYYLTVGCLFKNESHSIREWVEHYLSRGIDHVYLINDDSTDDSVEKIQDYIDANKITMFHSNQHPYHLGRQRDLYNIHFLPLVNNKEMKWLIICDMDEYLWSPKANNLKTLFQSLEHLGQVQFIHTIFGSNGHIEQPESVLRGFTKRSKDNPTTSPGNYKYAINSQYEFNSLNIHHATFVNLEYQNVDTFQIIVYPYFQLNHYSCQSKKFWEEVKMKRGDADSYRVRTIEEFNTFDMNDVEDLGILQTGCI